MQVYSWASIFSGIRDCCAVVSVDPLAGEYPFYTPYQYAGNQPIIAIDLDGLEPAGGTSGQSGANSSEHSQGQAPPDEYIPTVPTPSLSSFVDDGAFVQPTETQKAISEVKVNNIVHRSKVTSLQIKRAKAENFEDVIKITQELKAMGATHPEVEADQLGPHRPGEMELIETRLAQIVDRGEWVPNEVGQLQHRLRELEYISEGKDPSTLLPFKPKEQVYLDVAAVLLLRKGASRGAGGGNRGEKMVTVYHYTNKEAYKAITSDKTFRFKAGVPKHKPDHPHGVYVTTQSPAHNAKKPSRYKKLGVPGDKSKYYFEFQVPASEIKNLNLGRSFVKYINKDVHISRDLVKHDLTPKKQKKKY